MKTNQALSHQKGILSSIFNGRSASAGELHKSSNQTREISKRNSNICKSSTNYKYSQRGIHR